MSVSRRSVLGVMAGVAPAIIVRRATAAQAEGAQIAPGPFRGTRESLQGLPDAEWFRDAKFGIWAHWGPQSAAEDGDWYAQRMYIEGGEQYKYHLEHYGHPSKFGFKDVIRNLESRQIRSRSPDGSLQEGRARNTSSAWPSTTITSTCGTPSISRAGTRWRRGQEERCGDVPAGGRKRGLRFGVSEHLSNSYNWLPTSHRSDKNGARWPVCPTTATIPNTPTSTTTIPGRQVWTAQAIEP